jgi:hypothetical protein
MLDHNFVFQVFLHNWVYREGCEGLLPACARVLLGNTLPLVERGNLAVILHQLRVGNSNVVHATGECQIDASLGGKRRRAVGDYFYCEIELV